ncbi:efflux RND transporter periplasmic adaptor subunit [Aliiglaciecola sp. 3_MG-2023]|uniref:efflux RND transporter periplasmic adaptor subunit n=1 Tax=Aliiglaciecola sp. 3_MG-2023 TaxID=3062644 RepID=UPI0026E29CC9|nr:efflux RND transporter periplasmic adaptor subunit [Aliiglaciecola sp. 3_MG-2023]MDO6693612.1 efflux RND transporter periplasmic adaptor subunit [Aliiglaciecola sp. 3_MG-2023]
MKIEDTSGQDVVLANKKNKKPFIIIVVVGIALLASYFTLAPALSNWSSSDYSISAKRLRLGTVQKGNLVRDLSVQGRVVASVSPRLYSPAQGTITFKVDAGDSVKMNQVLALIDSPALTNELKQEESSLQRSQMELDREKIQAKKQALENQKAVDLALVALTAADREKRRADKAYATHSISQIDYEKAQDDLQNAKLVHQHAVRDAQLNQESLAFEIQTKQLQLARQRLLVEELTRKVDELTMRSPVNGIVGNLAVQQKNQVTQNQPILSVVDLSEFELEVDIPESYADDLAIGMPAEVSFNGETHSATLVTISPEIENNQVNGRVRFAAQNAAGETLKQPQGLRQNQRLTTRILMESKADVLMVQRGQFLDSGSGRIAYLVKDGMAEKTTISTGIRSLSNVEIMHGLNAGDTIIISGTEQFNGAQRILITN